MGPVTGYSLPRSRQEMRKNFQYDLALGATRLVTRQPAGHEAVHHGRSQPPYGADLVPGGGSLAH